MKVCKWLINTLVKEKLFIGRQICLLLERGGGVEEGVLQFSCAACGILRSSWLATVKQDAGLIGALGSYVLRQCFSA